MKIRFINSRYKTLFEVEDGSEVEVILFDGEVVKKVCKYIDETHFYFGSTCYHICQFAEMMERNGSICRMVIEVKAKVAQEVEKEIKLKATDKVTVYYFGSANSTVYEGRQTTVKTVKGWKQKGDKKAKDVAFVLQGLHRSLHGYEIDQYTAENNLTKLSIMDICI